MNKSLKNFLAGVMFGGLLLIITFFTGGFGDSKVALEIILQTPIMKIFDGFFISVCNIINSQQCVDWIKVNDVNFHLFEDVPALMFDFLILVVWYGVIFMVIGKLSEWFGKIVEKIVK